MDEYHIINLNDTMIKCYRDGRIFTLCKVTTKHGKKGEWIERSNKPRSHGYIQIKVGGKHYLAHRLIMLAFVGESDQEVDHINRIRHDNRFENLRYCTRRENALNMAMVDNTKGYTWYRNKWQAYIRINGKQKHLGCFDTEAEARQAFLDAKDKRENEP